MSSSQISLGQPLCIAHVFMTIICSSFTWQGLEWFIKSGNQLGPGPNDWASDNVYVDDNDYLHLDITYDSNTQQWLCSELWTYDPLPFGTYQWWVDSDLEFNENIVLGLFFYEGPDGLNEIVIEFSKWGHANNANNADYNVYPYTDGNQPTPIFWPISLNGGTHSTQRFAWATDSIEFWSMEGYNDITQTTNVVQTWKFEPNDSQNLIPQREMRLHMNLWLVAGNPPSDGQSVHVIITGFSYSAFAPSNIPTMFPTKNSTVSPTHNPTPAPAINPTQNLSKYPTKFPSIIVTQNSHSNSDSDSDSDSDSNSGDSNGLFGEFEAQSVKAATVPETEQSESAKRMEMIISFNSAAMEHLWIIVFVFVVFNSVCVWCYWNNFGKPQSQ